MADDSSDSERRISDRRPLRTQAVAWTADGKAMKVRTLDVSPGGMALSSATNPNQGTVLSIQFSIPKVTNGATVVKVRGEVTYSVLSGEVGGFKVGVRFSDVPQEAAEAIAGYIHR